MTVEEAKRELESYRYLWQKINREESRLKGQKRTACFA